MDDLTRRLADLGAPNPEGWAGSEMRENIAQQARFLFLRGLWPEAIDRWAGEEVIQRFPAGARLLAAGASGADLSTLVRVIAYETVFTVLDRVDGGRDPEAPDDAPGWRLMETDADERLTGRDVGGLHEDLLMLDPSGQDGTDLYE